jgi:hypothetical protein
MRLTAAAEEVRRTQQVSQAYAKWCDGGDTYGDILLAHLEEFFRVRLLNIGGIGHCNEHTKSKALRQFIVEKGLDVLGVTENNNHWKSVPPEHRLHECTRGWFEKIHVNYSYYEEYKETGIYQAGGTAIFSINQAADRVMGAGKDAELGRWSWTRYRGKQGIAVRIYTVYTPTKNKKDLGSTYNQHLDYFHEHGLEHDPPKAIIDDLCKEIEAAMKEGDQIAVILDANEDVRKGYAQEQFNCLGLSETVIDRHGQQAPNTYIDGLDPIDGIFVSPTLKGCKCGYAAFGDGPPGITH